MSGGLVVSARPTPFACEPSRTALVVVDMQNDFGAPGGMFDRAGIPIDGIRAAVAPTARALAAARGAGLAVLYLVMQYGPDLAEAGPPDGPNLIVHRRLGIGEAVAAPDGRRGRVLVRDTWNTEILPDLRPQPDDLVVEKHRFSGFVGTGLDALLRARDIDALVFTGCTTSVCVESTLRDACLRDYRCLLLEDCTAEPIGGDGPQGNHAATVRVVETLFGWVSHSEAWRAALAPAVTARA